MFDEIDRAYFAKRAREAREKADQVADPAIKRVHLNMAEEYGRRARGETPQVIVRF